MRIILLALLLLPCLTATSFAGACYSKANCKGRVLYRYGDEGTTPEACYGAGGRSVNSVTARRCYTLGLTQPEETRRPAPGPTRTPTGICTDSYCQCCTPPVRVKYGELCR